MHFVVWVKGSEMHRYIRSKFVCNPGGHLFKFVLRIILPRDKKSCKLQPHTGFIFDEFECIKDWAQLTPSEFVVEIIIERLKINISCVNDRKKILSGGFCNIASRYGY